MDVASLKIKRLSFTFMVGMEKFEKRIAMVETCTRQKTKNKAVTCHVISRKTYL